MTAKSLEMTAFAVLLYLGVTLLARGSEILIPVAVAVMIWYLLNALALVLKRVIPRGERLPRLALVGLAMGVVLLFMVLALDLLTISLSGISEALPKYQENINLILNRGATVLGMESAPGVGEMLKKVDLKWAVGGVAGIAAAIAGQMGLILVYVLFLILEQESFGNKMKALLPDSRRRARMGRLLDRIQESIREYVWIKTLMCLLVGALTYGVLLIIGVDYAFFWAFVAFLANYVPTVGSVVGIMLPALLALVQFPTPFQGVLTLLLLGALHFSVGNVLEPKLMGGKLNISAFVVILSLVVWGHLWGITGMFLCVPLTVIAMIILAHFPSTRPIAVLLSEDGEITLGDGEEG